jgi:response regulator RpfG family c-di-GMP phosphodiesterase
MSSIRILAVDDQISSLIALEDVLTSIDAQFIKATSAKEALLIMLKQSIDCILLDVSMPEMDGFEFLKTLRNAPNHAAIPVIMITGKIFSENETLKAYKFGAVDFLLKPLEPETVYRKVSFIVQQARRINAVSGVEQQLTSLEKNMLNPLEAMLVDDKTSLEQQARLSEVIQALKHLHTTWKGLSDGKQ